MLTTIDISKTKPTLSDLLIQVREHGVQFLLMDGDERVAHLSPLEPVEHVLWSEDNDDEEDGELWYPKTPERLQRSIDRALANELEPQTVSEFRREVGLDEDDAPQNGELTALDSLRSLVGRVSSGTSENEHKKTELSDRDYMLSIAGTVGSEESDTLSDVEYLRSLVGIFSSGTSDTSQNVKSIVSEMILKKHDRSINADESTD